MGINYDLPLGWIKKEVKPQRLRGSDSVFRKILVGCFLKGSNQWFRIVASIILENLTECIVKDTDLNTKGVNWRVNRRA